MKTFFKSLLFLSLALFAVSCEPDDDFLPPSPPAIDMGQPRYLAAYDGKVYVSYYNGYVARIDTSTFEIEATVKVGRNPEQLTVCDGKIYVANSGGMDWNTELGYDNTVSVIDVETFSEADRLEVVVNPAVIAAADNGVFLASYGDYGAVPGTLQFIGKDGSVSVVEACPNMTEICYSNGILYGFFSQYDANWNATITYMSYNPANGAVDSPWIKEDFLPVPYKVCTAGDYVCVTSSDYTNDGDVYAYDNSGKLVYCIPAGLNPIKVVSVADVKEKSPVYYVLNSGDWKTGNSSLTKYDSATGAVEQNFFESQNGRSLGNTANDIIVYGSKMYIAVAGESTIEVVDLDAKSLKQVE